MPASTAAFGTMTLHTLPARKMRLQQGDEIAGRQGVGDQPNRDRHAAQVEEEPREHHRRQERDQQSSPGWPRTGS